MPARFSYNIYTAIHVAQTELGITGTTALKASETISSSVAAMKSAWTNLLTQLGTGSGVNQEIDNLRELGVDDILLSGQKCNKIQETRIVPDEYLGRGPLGGLHVCLKEAKHSQCLVLCVDMPLIPCSALAKLCEAHIGGVTVLQHNKKQEPLIGVYDRGIAEKIPQLIKEGGAPVRALASVSGWNCFDYYGPEELLQNCNTMQDYQKTIDVTRKLNACGLL